MTTFEKLRLYHAVLGCGCVMAYLTGEFGWIHAWIGYTVAAIIAGRIVWGLFGPRQIGISRLVPTVAEVSAIRWVNHPAVSKVLLSGIIVSLLLVTATGIAIDQLAAATGQARRAEVGHSIGGISFGSPATNNGREATSFAISTARADDHRGDRRERGRESWLDKLHEGTANLLFIFVGLHVAYVFLFKRKLAIYMLFFDTPSIRIERTNG
jgi:cytochrome b